MAIRSRNICISNANILRLLQIALQLDHSFLMIDALSESSVLHLSVIDAQLLSYQPPHCGRLDSRTLSYKLKRVHKYFIYRYSRV